MTTEALFAQLKHPNPNLRERAIGELAENPSPETVSRLMAALDSEDVVFRRAAVKTLGAIGNETVPALVTVMLESNDATARSSAAKALAQVAVNYRGLEPFPEAGIQGLQTAMGDANPVVNIAAAMALGEVGSSAVTPLAETLAATDNPALAVAIVNALGATRDARASEILSTLSQDENADPLVRGSATSAISRIDLARNYRSQS